MYTIHIDAQFMRQSNPILAMLYFIDHCASQDWGNNFCFKNGGPKLGVSKRCLSPRIPKKTSVDASVLLSVDVVKCQCYQVFLSVDVFKCQCYQVLPSVDVVKCQCYQVLTLLSVVLPSFDVVKCQCCQVLTLLSVVLPSVDVVKCQPTKNQQYWMCI